MGIIIVLLIMSILLLTVSFAIQERSKWKNLFYWIAFCFLGSFYQSIYFVLSWNYDLSPDFNPMGATEVIVGGIILTLISYVASFPLVLVLNITLKKSQSALINLLVILGYFIVCALCSAIFNIELLKHAFVFLLPYFITALLVFLVWIRQDKKGSLE